MEMLIEVPWRVYPALALLLLGAGLAVLGIVQMVPLGRGSMKEPRPVVAAVRGIRRAVLGLALAGIGGAWLWQAGWLLALALVFGTEELFETSSALWALEKGRPGAANRGGTTPI
jgi:hypothetical protein